jgi:hypothetical protein
MTHDGNNVFLTNTLLTGNDGTNLGAPPQGRMALPETKLSLWVFALIFCIEALTAHFHGCDIKIRLT